jgi:putative flippase GtrA
VCQLVLLTLFTWCGWGADAAEVVAFLLATQANFVLSSYLTWRDRLAAPGEATAAWRRWVAYQGSTAAMAAVNLAVYRLAHPILPLQAAAALGIAAGALGNFVLGDRLVFQPRGGQPGTAPAARHSRKETAA